MSQETMSPTASSTLVIQVSAHTAQRGTTSSRPARPAGYWERVDAIVAAAPPLEAWQRARIRAAFHQPTATATATRRAA